MGQLKDVAFTYDDLDELWRLSLGEHADITAACFGGDEGKSLAQAQRDKRELILAGIGFRAGFRVLDIGCGWGGILKLVCERGGQALGLSLSPRQVEACRRHGLDARLQDWKRVRPGELGRFDAVVSAGAFEHFCSVEEYLAGQRDAIYSRFFDLSHALLADGAVLFLQTMTWGRGLPWGERDPTAEDIEACHPRAPRRSDQNVLGSLRAFFPGCWLPRDRAHLERLARPRFELLAAHDGRWDYVRTLTEWEKAWWAPGPGKAAARLRLAARYLTGGRAFRAKMRCLRRNDIREVFLRGLFGHQRLFFRKRALA